MKFLLILVTAATLAYPVISRADLPQNPMPTHRIVILNSREVGLAGMLSHVGSGTPATIVSDYQVANFDNRLLPVIFEAGLTAYAETLLNQNVLMTGVAAARIINGKSFPVMYVYSLEKDQPLDPWLKK